MTRTKKSTLAFAITALFGITALFSTVATYHADEPEQTQEKTEVRVVEELAWEGTPTAGWGSVNKNLHNEGGPLVVGGVTYTENSIGTHMPAAYGAQDIVYDISAYSAEFPYLDMKVAMSDNAGVNNVNFIALADDVEVDRVHWNWTAFGGSFDDANKPAAHKPLALRAYVGGAKKLTLRLLGGDSTSSYSYANGACAFLDVKLLKDTWDGYMPATRIYDRIINPGTGGWSAGYGDGVAFAANVAGDPLSYMMYTDPISYEDGMGVHLKNVSYETYGADKINAGNFVSLKWDIAGKNYSAFSALAYAALGFGFHVDAWIDGKEAYTSGKIESIGTLVHYERDARTAPKDISVSIPAGSETFELRIIADTVYDDGQVNLACPVFFEHGDKLVSLAAVQTAGGAYPMQMPRTYMRDGRRTEYYDAATDKNVIAEDGLFFVADTSYVFDISDVKHNTLAGILGKADYGHMSDEGITPLRLEYAVEDKDGNKTTGFTDSIEKSTSGKRVTIPLGKNAVKLTLTMRSENSGFSESVFAGATFADMYDVTFVNGDDRTTQSYEPGAALTPPTAPQKTGYTFAGWKLDGEGDVYDFTNKTVTADMTFTAVWTANVYDVKYKIKLGESEPVDGSSDYPQAVYTYNEQMTLPTAKTVEGYDFIGWYVGDDKVENLAAETYTAEITVVAVYTVQGYTITFKVGETTHSTVKVAYGGKITPPTAPQKTGYTFTGWKLDGEIYDFDTPVSGEMTLVADFEPANYTIIYEQQLGTSAPTAVTYMPDKHVYGTETALPTANKVQGYVFVGWYVGDTAVTSIAAHGYTANITVTAKYRTETVKAVFVSEGKEFEVEYDVGQIVSPKLLTRDGYEFVGWFTDEAYENEYKFDRPIGADIRLYAKWNKVSSKPDDDSDVGLIVGIVVPVAVVLIGGGVAAFIVVRKRKSKAPGTIEDNDDASDGNDGK